VISLEKILISKDHACQGAAGGPPREDGDLGAEGLAGSWPHQGDKSTAPSEPSPARGSQA